MLTARLTPLLFALAFGRDFASLFSPFSLIPMKQKMFALSAAVLLFAGSVLAVGTAPHATTKAAARKSCPITKSYPASMCQSAGKATAACPPRSGCCMK